MAIIWNLDQQMIFSGSSVLSLTLFSDKRVHSDNIKHTDFS